MHHIGNFVDTHLEGMRILHSEGPGCTTYDPCTGRMIGNDDELVLVDITPQAGASTSRSFDK